MNAPNPMREACADVTRYQERSRIYRGMSFSRDELVQARDQLKKIFTMFDQAVDMMAETFDGEHMVECKFACEHLALAARAVADRREPYQIEALAKSMAGTLATHLSRKARV